MNEKPKHPEKIYNVSQGQLSIARFYGGIKYNGREYMYDPKNDVLIREDKLKEYYALLDFATELERRAVECNETLEEMK